MSADQKCEAQDNPRLMCTNYEERWIEFDGRGIALEYVCGECREGKMKKYRPEILRPYTQADVDEPIEPDGDW